MELLFIAAKSTGPGPALVFGGAMVGILVLIIVIAVVIGSKQKANQTNWAQSVGLRYVSKGLKGIDEIEGVYKGFAVHIGTQMIWGTQSKPLYNFTAFFQQPIASPFEVEKPSEYITFGGRDVGPRVKSGNASIDSTFTVEAANGNEIKALLQDNRVSSVLLNAASRFEDVFLCEDCVRLVTKPSGISTAQWTPILNQVVAMANIIWSAATGEAPQPMQTPRGKKSSQRTVAAPPPVQEAPQSPSGTRWITSPEQMAPVQAPPVVAPPPAAKKPISNRQPSTRRKPPGK
ncbi:hypothetical protein PLCT1_02415 [Planctomycetaceae bacterium]|nr:hypothetical protein PLCT1_02415 [Planctomycetaceae bacterium]